MTRAWIAIAAIALLFGSASADTLFATDFQSGKSEPWTARGKGDVRLTTYAGNVSMRLMDHAEAIASVKTAGVARVAIEGSLAAMKLSAGDGCFVEYSTDNGTSWKTVLTVGAAKADGLTLHSGHAGEVDVSATPALLLRLRASLSLADGACWGDAISVNAEQATEAPETTRSRLLASELDGGRIAGPVRMQAFAKPAWATAPAASFEGRLRLDAPVFDGFQMVRNVPYNIAVDAITKSLPPFDFSFVSDGGALIPLQRGPIAGAHRDWEWLLEPGALWQEAGDGGLTRAALPFALREKGANCLHNGVLSFVFDGGGKISRVYYQISSETCAYFKFNAWGSAAAHYAPGVVAGAAAVKAAYRAEVAARLPVRPLSELAAAHPTLSPSGFALAHPADGDVPTLYGVVVDGVNFVGGCETRDGPYPYCDVEDLPSYSTAKTVFGAIGLMRLEKLWPGARSALISDYVPECATADWAGVTFEDVLNMTSGVYGDPGFEADENSEANRAFFNTDLHAGKIAFACTHYHRRSPPGKVWVYRTTDTYVLGTAMQAFARAHLGANADLYRDVHVAQLWRALHLSPVLDDSLRTYDTARQPFAGYGLTYHRDDIARIARFLAGDEPLLDPALRARALQRDPAHRGMQAGYPHFTYVGGVWARDIAPELGCAKETWVPFMSGFGGNSIVMLPNGVIYYYFGDSEVWDWSSAAIEINKLKPVCS